MTTGRDDLKLHFKAGSLPTEQDFHGLIDSMLHMEDEGFRRSYEHGLKVSSAPTKDALLTFSRKEDADTPLWSFRHAESGRRLDLHAYADLDWQHKPLEPLLTLERTGRLGVGVSEPQHRLHVDGFLGSIGRVGTYQIPTPPQPDGRWHVIADQLHGCVAFEVVASAHDGSDVPQRMTIIQAHAMNAGNPRYGGLWGWLDDRLDGWLDRTFNTKKRIRVQESRYGQRCDSIELSWRPGIDKDNKPCYTLAIRTRCDFGSNGRLDVRLTQLWPVPDPRPIPVATPRTASKVRNRPGLRTGA